MKTITAIAKNVPKLESDTWLVLPSKDEFEISDAALHKHIYGWMLHHYSNLMFDTWHDETVPCTYWNLYVSSINKM